MKYGKYLLIFTVLLSLCNLVISFFFVFSCNLNLGVAFGIYIEWVAMWSCIAIFLLVLLAFTVKGDMRYIFLSIAVLGFTNFLERLITGHICDYIPLFSLYVNLIDIWITILVGFAILICIREIYGKKSR